MKRFLSVGIVLAALTLSACGANEEPKSTTANEVPEIVKVKLTVPKTVTVGEEVALTAVITQAGEIVEDADEVEFEVLNLTTGEKEMIKASLNEDKHYAITYTFETKGKYDITSHVTARDMHTMPTKQITVTDGEDVSATTEEAQGENHHHDQGATIDFTEGPITVGKATMLVATVSLSKVPLEGAQVRYEISHNDDEHHTWVEVPEVKAGVYQLEFTFTESRL
jgi:hypothetical protein